ncbi:hypothetical protein D3C85_846800 [compost metagenome]
MQCDVHDIYQQPDEEIHTFSPVPRLVHLAKFPLYKQEHRSHQFHTAALVPPQAQPRNLPPHPILSPGIDDSHEPRQASIYGYLQDETGHATVPRNQVPLKLRRQLHLLYLQASLPSFFVPLWQQDPFPSHIPFCHPYRSLPKHIDRCSKNKNRTRKAYFKPRHFQWRMCGLLTCNKFFPIY